MCDKSKMTSTIEHESSQSLTFKLHPPGYLYFKYSEKMQFIHKVLLYSCRGLSSWFRLLLFCSTTQSSCIYNTETTKAWKKGEIQSFKETEGK